MLKDITNTIQNQQKEDTQQQNIQPQKEVSQQENQNQLKSGEKKQQKISQSKIKSFSAEKEKKSCVSIEEQITCNYTLLFKQLQEPVDSLNAYHTLKKLSYLFSQEKITAQSANVQYIFDLGLLELILKDINSYSKFNNGLDLQNAAIWLLANVLALVSEEQINQLIEKLPVIEILIQFILSDSPNNIEQSLWALANMISYIDIRDIAIEKNLVDHLLVLISKMTNNQSEQLFTLKINRTLTWLISNLCRKPSPPYFLTVNFLPYLATMIHFNDDQILRDACLAIGNLVLAENNSREDDQNQIEEILNFHIGERCIVLLQNPSKEVQMASLVLLGHLTYGNEKQTQRLIESGVLGGIKQIIQLPEGYQRKKEALFALSNIIAGNSEQLSRVLESGILIEIKNQMNNIPVKQVIDECLFCFMNATYIANIQQMEQIQEMKILEVLLAQYRMRKAQGDPMIEDIMEAIDNIIQMIPEFSTRVETMLMKVGLENLVEKKKLVMEIMKNQDINASTQDDSKQQ